MALFKNIIFRDLKVSEGFLREHSELIEKKLALAASDLSENHGDIFAINQCLHLASTFVLGNTTHLDETLNKVRSTGGFEAMDATTVVTIAMLYVILLGESKKAANDKPRADSMKRLLERFDEINWLIGRDAMHRLGIEPLDS